MIKEYDPNKQYDSQHHSNADGLRWTCISDGERR